MCMFCIWVYTLVDTPQCHKLCNELGRVVTYGLPSLSSTTPGGNFVPSGSVFDPLGPAVALMLGLYYPLFCFYRRLIIRIELKCRCGTKVDG